MLQEGVRESLARLRAAIRAHLAARPDLRDYAAVVLAPAPVVRDLLLGALNSAGLAGRPPAETAAAAEALIMIPSAPR